MTRRALVLTREEVIQDIKNYYGEHGKCSKRAFYSSTPYSEAYVQQNIANFNELKIEALGESSVRLNAVSKEQVVEDVLRVNKEYGRLSKAFYLEHGKYSRKPIERHFGSFNKMLVELGIPTNRYKHAEKVIRLFEEVLGTKAIQEKTFDWLKNDKTGYNMYLDAFFEEHNIVLEHHGIQHYEFVPFMEKYEGAFEERQYRDKLKKKLCLEQGMKFIEFAYNEPITRQNVISKLMNVN